METKDKRIMVQAKKLIEVAMPIKEISAESVRDKSIRHGHISTLHLWWARRPLPVCRAVIFGSLIPDPLDENCPQVVRDAIEIILGKNNNPGDPYKPYADIPYTSIMDPMEDNCRNRLLMFIGKFSDKYIQNEKTGKSTGAKDQISDYSLIKWENKNNEEIIGKARKLIWVSFNYSKNNNALELIKQYEIHHQSIKIAEENLYSTLNRHLKEINTNKLEKELQIAIKAFLDNMPTVFDPFAGGGAIPLEAARLGCNSFGNDINPVAHIIQKGSLEFPQKFGKPISFTKSEYSKIYGRDALLEWCKKNNKHIDSDDLIIHIPNQLSHDVEFYAKKLIKDTESDVGYLYPDDDKGNKLIAYFVYRHAKCANPTCSKYIPLIKNFNYSNKSNKQVNLDYEIIDSEIRFSIAKKNIEHKSFVEKGNLTCPFCKNITSNSQLKEQFKNNQISEKSLASVYESDKGKFYTIEIKEQPTINIENLIVPSEQMERNSAGGDTFGWGITNWKEIFNNRQLIVINSLIKNFNKIFISVDDEYQKALATYLSIFIDKLMLRLTKFGVWHNGAENVEHLYGRQAISMKFEYPEANIFSNSTSGSALNQLEGIIRYLNEESKNFNFTICNNASSGEINQFDQNTLDATVTDPPYYDAIAYADLSDFFYVWLKKYLNKFYPIIFSTPKTPKAEECTALKYHHGGDKEKARIHFEEKLMEIFSAIQYQTNSNGIVSIMYAHQSTEAWSTLCNSILGSKMNITGSWAIESEQTSALKATQAFLASSVTVSARPSSPIGVGNYREVKKAVENKVANEVDILYRLGFRGSDLLTACFGQAVSEFGKYEKVEKADGSEVTVAELLEMARESAFNALLKGFEGDDFTKFYIGWLQLYSFGESEFDDAAKFSRVGLKINVGELFTEHILIKNGNKQTLGTFDERIKANKNIGDRANNFLIDLVHRAMALYKGSNRNALLQYIEKVASQPESNFWRVVTSLCEVLPAGCEDHKQALGLLTNKDSLIRESKTVQTATTTQTNLFES